MMAITAITATTGRVVPSPVRALCTRVHVRRAGCIALVRISSGLLSHTPFKALYS
jgi:hypothetical protein